MTHYADLAELVGRELLDVQRVELAAAGGVRRCVSAYLLVAWGTHFRLDRVLQKR